jgi:hypothetical protein
MMNSIASRIFQDSLAYNPSMRDSLAIPAQRNTAIIRDSDDSVFERATVNIHTTDSSYKRQRNIILNQKITVIDLLVVDSAPINKNEIQVIKAEKYWQYRNFNPPISRFGFFHSGEQEINYEPKQFWVEEVGDKSETKQLISIPHHYQRSQFNWTLIIGLLSVMLLMGLKTYYQKFVNQVVNTMVNFQLADKMLREKNIIVRRAFFMMNLNFILMLGLFVMLLENYAQIQFTKHYFYDYLIILAAIILILLLRLLLLYLGGFIFETRQAINEQIHSSYLINKNLGLLLLPLVFTAVYTTQIISNIILVTGLIIISIATLYRLIRVFQIILRNGVLLYYAILYLCTLELLPLVIGSKILILLR